MHEHLSTTPEVASSRPNPADLGGAAIAAAERQELPVVDVELQESERKKNTGENLRALQKRFGERFVKGEWMEGGGYTGGAARELLAGFVDQPDFAGELKRLIPGKYGALKLLRDNHAYIQATLEQWHKDDPTHERAPVKDPYELARSVGYELTGPFTSTSEFVPYDKLDFPSGELGKERLCTFNNPGERLKNYHILWLRHTEVADTLPADQLTEDNLSEAWKTYLKTIGRYDQNSDTYDLANLRPTRDDPYGTSSMSVQVSRKGTHVSVKNRYNHTVGNPDNTLDSNLNNVAYGLKRAVYAQIGREDLMDKNSVALAEGYIADNEGGIHAYEYEENNVYWGEYEYIEDGTLTTVDRGAYVMISPQLYVPRSGKGEALNLRPRTTEGAALAIGQDIRFLHKSSQAKGSEKDPRMAELRQEYAERDRAELSQILHETLLQQARAAYDTYRDTAVELGAREVMTEAAFAGLLERKEIEWQERGVLDYLVKELIEKGSSPNLVATPNVLADWQQLRKIAVDFGKDQPYETYVYDDLYKQYSAEQLSGKTGDEPVRLSIIPSVYNLEYGDVATQRAQLTELQTAQPELHFAVPSVLDSLTHLRTLRARYGEVDGFNATYIRHIDLPEQQLVGWSRVPDSCVDVNGTPYLFYSGVDYDNAGRVSVG